MITSAEKFIKLRESEKQEEYFRASHEAATEEIWLNVIEHYPDYKVWVAPTRSS